MKQLWWGYKHTSGSFQAKPYMGKLDIEEAHQSGFCKYVVGPFEAVTREQALSHVEGVTNGYEWESRNGEYPIEETSAVHLAAPGTLVDLILYSSSAHGKLTIYDGKDPLMEFDIRPGEPSKVTRFNTKFGDSIRSVFRGIGVPHYQINAQPRAQ